MIRLVLLLAKVFSHESPRFLVLVQPVADLAVQVMKTELKQNTQHSGSRLEFQCVGGQFRKDHNLKPDLDDLRESISK